jgi:hypothetical protein
MGNYYRRLTDCLQCQKEIENAVYNYSTQNYGHALCKSCQSWFKNVTSYSTATKESVNLYFALKKLQVPAFLEVNDGFKTVDISVPDAKVHIEVDGKHHTHNPNQALADLKRTVHALKDGFITLRVPNSLVQHNLDEAAKWVCDLLIEHRDQTKITYKKYENDARHIGYCMRCKEKTNFNPTKPLCYDCYQSWAVYQNYIYPENVCHCCGNDEDVSMSKPLCYHCYKAQV